MLKPSPSTGTCFVAGAVPDDSRYLGGTVDRCRPVTRAANLPACGLFPSPPPRRQTLCLTTTLTGPPRLPALPQTACRSSCYSCTLSAAANILPSLPYYSYANHYWAGGFYRCTVPFSAFVVLRPTPYCMPVLGTVPHNDYQPDAGFA